ncbi:serine/threonine protein kinase [Candidatus Berkelbacteria bacterium]|nr:serine/threonine protein kinase [Candidatus Berkelbacteria bacterium]
MATHAPQQKIGEYTIIRLIAQGGVAEVYEAEHSRLQRRVALKFQSLAAAQAAGMSTAVFQQAYQNECRYMAQVGHHPNIPEVYDAFCTPTGFYLVMELIEGEDLARVRTGRAITEEECVDWTIQLLEAVKYLQTLGIVFRDVKPQNIIRRTKDGRVFLVDFGIARHVQQANQVALGTPEYAAPEQHSGQSDFRSDIFALGVTMWHLLTGLRPTKMALDWTKVGAVSPLLITIMAKAVERLPADRWQTAEEMLHELRALSSGSGGLGIVSRAASQAASGVTFKPTQELLNALAEVKLPAATRLIHRWDWYDLGFRSQTVPDSARQGRLHAFKRLEQWILAGHLGAALSEAAHLTEAMKQAKQPEEEGMVDEILIVLALLQLADGKDQAARANFEASALLDPSRVLPFQKITEIDRRIQQKIYYRQQRRKQWLKLAIRWLVGPIRAGWTLLGQLVGFCLAHRGGWQDAAELFCGSHWWLFDLALLAGVAGGFAWHGPTGPATFDAAAIAMITLGTLVGYGGVWLLRGAVYLYGNQNSLDPPWPVAVFVGLAAIFLWQTIWFGPNGDAIKRSYRQFRVGF